MSEAMTHSPVHSLLRDVRDDRSDYMRHAKIHRVLVMTGEKLVGVGDDQRHHRRSRRRQADGAHLRVRAAAPSGAAQMDPPGVATNATGIRGRVRLRHRGTIRWCVSIGDPATDPAGESHLVHGRVQHPPLYVQGSSALRRSRAARDRDTANGADRRERIGATVGERDRRQARLRHRRHEPPSPRGAPGRPACDDRLPAHDLRDRSHHAGRRLRGSPDS